MRFRFDTPPVQRTEDFRRKCGGTAKEQSPQNGKKVGKEQSPQNGAKVGKTLLFN